VQIFEAWNIDCSPRLSWYQNKTCQVKPTLCLLNLVHIVHCQRTQWCHNLLISCIMATSIWRRHAWSNACMESTAHNKYVVGFFATEYSNNNTTFLSLLVHNITKGHTSIWKPYCDLMKPFKINQGTQLVMAPLWKFGQPTWEDSSIPKKLFVQNYK
jgi:hypothetical protein